MDGVSGPCSETRFPMTRIEAIRQLLKEAAKYPDGTLTFEAVCELIHLWDTRETALRALVEQWKQESMKADADSFWEADQKAQALAGRASGLLTCAEALS